MFSIAVGIAKCCVHKRNKRPNNDRVISQQPMAVQSILPKFQPDVNNSHTRTLTDPLPPPYILQNETCSPLANNNPNFNENSNTGRTIQMKSKNDMFYPVLPQQFEPEVSDYL